MLGYYNNKENTALKKFITLASGANVITFFTAIIYKCSYQARVFVRLGLKILPKTNASVFEVVYCRLKKNYNIGPRCQCYNIFYSRNLQIFVLSWSVCQTRLENLVRVKYSSVI
jgi:hypothetical protein